MTTQPSSGKNSDSLSIGLGALLILLGLVFLIGQFIDINLGSVAWPFFVIVPGVLLFVFALTLKGSVGEALATLGAMLTTTGLILFYQNLTDQWQTWAYLWALIAPTSAGVGQLFYGTLHSRPEMIRTGMRIAGVGLILFLVAAFFFELVIGISGFGIGTLGWSLVLIVLGILVIARPWLVRLFRQ
jgi:hypothetical protein